MRLLALAAVVALSAASASASPQRDPWRALHRPLHLPHIAPNGACPTSASTDAHRLASPFSGYALGRGPIYAGAMPKDAVVRFDPARADADGWSGLKILWIARPGHRERVLVRGRRLDGPGALRFAGGAEMRLAHWGTAEGAPGWGHIPSEEWFRGAGCYGLQLDGKRFSRVIVFRTAPA